MDNFRIDVTAIGHKALEHAVALALAYASGGKVVAYRTDPKKGLVLYWTIPKQSLNQTQVVPLLFPHGPEQTIQLIEGWLAQQDYGHEPDHDGSNGNGWRIYNEAWGHIDGEWEAFMAVQPAWAMYGK